MKVRVDIFQLLHQGHTNADISRITGVSPSTVAKARTKLRLDNVPRRPVSPRERLLTEDLPTGLVREYRQRRRPVSPEEAAANRAALVAALRGDAA